MKLIDQAAYEDWKDKQEGDGYGLACFEFAEKWADLMEVELADDPARPFHDFAEACSSKANKGIGITGFMYGMAVGILSNCWEHGEQLRQWHNLDTQIGDEGEKANESGGVLNPSLLSVT